MVTSSARRRREKLGRYPPVPRLLSFSGHVQTPHWNGDKVYFPRMDSFAHVTVPEGHVIMISFPVFSLPDTFLCCSSHVLRIYIGGNTSAHIVQMKYTSPPPAIYNTTDLFVRLTSNDLTARASIQMQFTFHNRTATPEKLQNMKWNCSVTFWSEFQPHFPCNLIPECEGDEDEIGCPYTSESCGGGDFFVAGKCFRYVRPERRLTSWNQASEGCSRHGARLAVFSSNEIWDTVSRLLHQYKHDTTAFIGLKSSSPSLPFM